jgi:hypothetical protein
MIATISTPHNLISGPPGLIKFDKEGVAYTVIQNCSPYAIWIKRNDPMGFAEQHTEEEKAEKLDKKFLAYFLKDVTINSIQQEKTKLWTDKAKMEKPLDQQEDKYREIQYRQIKFVNKETDQLVETLPN